MSPHAIEHITFINHAADATLKGRYVFPQASHPLPTVLFLTGDGPKGSNSLSWVNLPPLLAVHGVASFLFDFSGLGDSPGDRSHLTLTRAGQDFAAAYETVCADPRVDSQRVALFGSSLGAAAALLNPDIANMVKALALKSPASFLADAYANESGDADLQAWLSSGYSEKLAYSSEVLVDALQHNIFASASQIRTPCLITHGTADEIVPFRHSLYLATCLAGPTRLEPFECVGHGYSEDGAWDRMAAIFVEWLTATL